MVEATKAPPFAVESMAVKEMFDASEQLVGHAVLLKSSSGTAREGWTSYCYGPADRCLSGSSSITAQNPMYNHGDCVGCHGGFFFTRIP